MKEFKYYSTKKSALQKAKKKLQKANVFKQKKKKTFKENRRNMGLLGPPGRLTWSWSF